MFSVTTCSLWLVYIGERDEVHETESASTEYMISDGQKRPVFIYRLLTAGTIDGEVSAREAACSGTDGFDL